MGFGFCMCVLVCDLQSRLPVWPLPLKQSGAFQGTAWFLPFACQVGKVPCCAGLQVCYVCPFPESSQQATGCSLGF